MLLTCLLALLVSAADSGPVIRACFTPRPPTIDGDIEDLWLTADSASGFVQLMPDNGRRATDRTTAYLLYDHRNLYVAFRCAVADASTATARLSGDCDGVRLLLDTFGDRTTAYGLVVYFSGREDDYRLSDNGNWSEQWDGVWRSGVRRHPWGFAIEFAIPFKSLRYDPMSPARRWGIDFGRYTVATGEKAFWAPHGRTGFRVNEMGWLDGIEPGSTGLHLELYPVAMVRSDLSDLGSRAGLAQPATGFDASWLPTSTANLQLTAFPDFAEIEADPYQVNLSRYELWLAERRPFFVEAAENFGSGYQPISLFYSRRIGRPLPDGSAVPILAGLKFTDRDELNKVGALAALCGRTEWGWHGTGYDEPAALFTVLSARRQFVGTSEAGLLLASKTGSDLVNHGACLDAVIRRGDLTCRVFGAGSLFGDSIGSAFAADAGYRSSAFSGKMEVKQVGPTFDMNGVGFTTWRGQSALVSAGPDWYATGPFRYAGISGYVSASREWDYPATFPDLSAGASSYFQFRNLTELSIWGSWGRSLYRDTAGAWQACQSPDGGWSLSTGTAAPLNVSAWGHWSQAMFNYRRRLLAPAAQGGVTFGARLGDRVSLSVDNGAVLEFGPGYELDLDEDLTVTCDPHVQLSFTPRMDIAFGGEIVRGWSPAADTPYNSYYATLLYRWNIRPRSTFYIAFNQRLDNSSGPLSLTDRVAVVKLRYLFVF